MFYRGLYCLIAESVYCVCSSNRLVGSVLLWWVCDTHNTHRICLSPRFHSVQSPSHLVDFDSQRVIVMIFVPCSMHAFRVRVMHAIIIIIILKDY